MIHVSVADRQTRKKQLQQKEEGRERKKERRKKKKMEKPTATPRPKTEATSSNASKTIINDISAEYVSAISAFFQKVGVSHSNSIPDFCNTKYFYSHLIRDAIKPDQVLRGRITCHLTVTPILAVTISPLFFSNSSFFFF